MHFHYARYRKAMKRHWKIPINNDICYNFITVHLVLAAAPRIPFPLHEETKPAGFISFWPSFPESGPYPPPSPQSCCAWESCRQCQPHIPGTPCPRLCPARSQHQEVAARTRMSPTEPGQAQPGSSSHIFVPHFEEVKPELWPLLIHP